MFEFLGAYCLQKRSMVAGDWPFSTCWQTLAKSWGCARAKTSEKVASHFACSSLLIGFPFFIFPKKNALVRVRGRVGNPSYGERLKITP